MTILISDLVNKMTDEYDVECRYGIWKTDSFKSWSDIDAEFEKMCAEDDAEIEEFGAYLKAEEEKHNYAFAYTDEEFRAWLKAEEDNDDDDKDEEEDDDSNITENHSNPQLLTETLSIHADVN